MYFQVLEAVVKDVFNACKIKKGNSGETTRILRSMFITCNQFKLTQTEHTKVIFVPEQPISSERKKKKDLKMRCENVTQLEGPKAVLWNLHYCTLLAEEFNNYTAFVEYVLSCPVNRFTFLISGMQKL